MKPLRCSWAEHESTWDYHDSVWGVPVHDDETLFEFLTLEGAQAGLSWATILKRQRTYRKAFADWNVARIAMFTRKDFDRLMQDKGIIRNRLKIESTIGNARAFIKVQEEFGSFDRYLWNFVDHKPVVNRFQSIKDMPATTAISDTLSKDLKKRGFTFCGSTICYALMQAMGMVNDHEVTCPRWKQVQKKK
jgi:DNA-3-methyladenine glycosylase I